MKKQHYFFLFTFCGLSFFSLAQIQKGAILLGGEVSGYTIKTTIANKDYIQNNILISPSLGKAVKENLIVGVNLFAGGGKYESTNAPSQKSQVYGGGIYIRKYKPIATSGFLVFVQGRAAANFSELKLTSTFNEKQKRASISLSAYPGIAYAISKRLQLETGLNNLISLEYNRENTNGVNANTPYTRTSTMFSIYSSLSSISTLNNVYAGFRLLLN